MAQPQVPSLVLEHAAVASHPYRLLTPLSLFEHGAPLSCSSQPFALSLQKHSAPSSQIHIRSRIKTWCPTAFLKSSVILTCRQTCRSSCVIVTQFDVTVTYRDPRQPWRSSLRVCQGTPPGIDMFELELPRDLRDPLSSQARIRRTWAPPPPHTHHHWP